MSSTRAFHPSVTPLETRALLTTGTQIALQVSSAALIYGQAETIIATVTTTPPSANTPTGGTVTFEDSGAPLASEPLVDGTASFRTTALEAGLHVLTAIYGGDTDFTGSATAPTPTSTISVIAGNTDNGDGGPANIAALNSPEGMALDAQGDLFIADTSDDQIREVNCETGVISTVAGDGQSGYAGDGGPATAAALDEPNGVAVDATGDLYIADAGNNVVREVKNGTITTIAGDGTGGYSGDGGPATASELADPTSVAVNAQGDLFIADSQNDVIREVNALTGAITTIAGDGQGGYSGDGGSATSAELDDPLGVAVDAQGDLFIADTNNHSVREVSSATGVISTVAGDGTPGYTQPEGTATGAGLLSPDAVAVDGEGDLFIADEGIDAVLEVTAGVISTIAGDGTYGYKGDDGAATAAELAGPSGVVVNGQGHVFIADSGNDVIREVAVGTITTVAGDHHIGRAGDGQAATAAELDNPTGVAMDAQGDLFIADSQDNVVREVNALTGIGILDRRRKTATAATAATVGPPIHATLNDPIGVAVDSSGDLFIADSGNNVVREVSGGIISTVAGNGTSGYVGDGRPALEAELDDPVGVAVNSSGDVFIADSGNNVVREVTHGLILTLAGDHRAGYSGDGGPATAAALANPSGVAVDSQGDLFIADSGNDVVREVTGGVISTVAGDGTAGYDGDGGSAEAAELDDPTGIAVDSSGDLFIAETGNSTVREVIGSAISTIAGNGNYGAADLDGPATSTELGDLGGVTVDASGNVFVSDGSDHVVYEVPTITGAQDISVAPAPLTVTASPQDMTYGGAVPALTYQITGFVNGDTIAAIGGTPSLSTIASSATGVGSYPILVTAGTFVAADYDLPSANLVGSTLSIRPAPLTVTANSQNMRYGGAVPQRDLPDPPKASLPNGDTIAAIGGTPKPVHHREFRDRGRQLSDPGHRRNLCGRQL